MNQIMKKHGNFIKLLNFIKLFKACCKSMLDNSIIWLHYKILFNMLSSRDCLYELKLTHNNLCEFCHHSPEAIMHLFCECDKVNDLWSNIKQWIFMKTRISINFLKSTKLLGFHELDLMYWSLNLVIMSTKNISSVVHVKNSD